MGRSTLAASFARAAAAAGKRTLLAELEDDTGADSPLARSFGKARFTNEALSLTPNLKGMVLSAVTGQERFLNSFLKIQTLTRTILSNQGIRWFLEGAPAFKEMGFFYHLLLQLREDYEVIVLDLPATGHLVGLARLPRILLKMIPFGPIAERLKEGQTYFYDPKLTAAWIVTLPQPLPVSEALELKAALREEKISIGGFILNRVPRDPFDDQEQAQLEAAFKFRPELKSGFLLERIRLFREAKIKLIAAVRASDESTGLWLAPEMIEGPKPEEFLRKIVRQEC